MLNTIIYAIGAKLFIGHFKKVQSREDKIIEHIPDDFNQLCEFVKMLNKSSEIAGVVSKAPNPGFIIQIAEEKGFAFSLSTLRKYSRELKADHWPWAKKSQNWRNKFFDAQKY